MTAAVFNFCTGEADPKQGIGNDDHQEKSPSIIWSQQFEEAVKDCCEDDFKSDVSLLSQLYTACQSREGYLEDIFAHENTPHPPSISQIGTLNCWHKCKSREMSKYK